jgi:hypothetical protein
VRRLATSSLLGCLVPACAEELPDESVIESTRPLAVRVEVTAPVVPDEEGAATRCQALPFETVTLTPWVVAPEGPLEPDAVDPVWIACPLNPSQGLFGCISTHFPTQLDDLQSCPPPELPGPDATELPEYPAPCVIGRRGVVELAVPFVSNILIGGDLEVTMIGSTPGGTSTDTCAQRLLGGDHRVPDDCILAVQRIELGPLDRLLLLADEYGIDLGDFEPPDPENVPDFDRNPRISRLQVGVLGEDGEPSALVDVGRGNVVKAKLGDTLRIATSVPEEDLQSFVLELNDGSQEEVVETLHGHYFRSWGELLSGSIDDPEAYTEWTLLPQDNEAPERPPGDRATIFLVLRDSRVGVDSWWFSVDLSG